MTMDEIWKDIVLQDVDVGRYQVSNFGNIRSNDWKVRNRYGYRIVKGHKMKCFGYPYLSCSLSDKFYYVHRLVAIHFIANLENLPFVNHIDGDVKNNTVDNLEWCSKSTNAQHMYEHGMSKKAVPVMCVEDNIVFRSISEAAHFYHLYNEDITKRLFNVPQELYSMRGKFNKHFLRCNSIESKMSIKDMVKENKIRDITFTEPKGVRKCERIPVTCIETGEIFESMSKAANVLRVFGSDIRRCIDNPKYTCKGYHFKRL